MTQKKVIVVGAGLSGLSAARLLKERDVDVVVLEAESRVGGRTCTVLPHGDDPDFGWADLGASYVGPTQDHVLGLCEELGCKTYLCSDKFDNIHYSRGRRFRMEGLIPSLWLRHPLAAWDLVDMMRRLEKMTRTIPPDRPWDAPKAKEWDQITVREFLKDKCWTKRASEFLLSQVLQDNTADDHEMSLLFYLWYLRQGNGARHLWAVTGGAQERKLVGGSQQLANKMAEQLGESVILNQPVVRIRHGRDQVIVNTLDGSEFIGTQLILAMPPSVQMKLHFEPSLPMPRHCLIQRSPMGIVMKCVIFYKECFWEKKGFNGYVCCADGVEVVGLTTEDRKPGVTLIGLICFVYTDHVVRLCQLPLEARKMEVCKVLAKFFDSDQAMKPVHYVEKTWPSEQYVGGGYTCFYPPGVMTRFGRAIRDSPAPSIFLAGTETATHWTGYMNGAIDAGQRAAREVLHAVGKLKYEEVWVQAPLVRHPSSCLETFLPTLSTMTVLLILVLLAGFLAATFFAVDAVCEETSR